MLDIQSLGLFVVASLVLLVVPGPAVMYIVARSADQGTRAGLVSVAGIHLGTLVHIAAAVVGLSAVVATSATAFTVVKLAGAAYLVWLGIQTLRRRGSSRVETGTRQRSLRRVFWDGTVVNVLNPKTALFFLAFVPQFVDPSAGSATLQLVTLGGLFILIGLITDGAYALAGGVVGTWLEKRPHLDRNRRLVSGIAYIGLGVTAALSGRPR